MDAMSLVISETLDGRSSELFPQVLALPSYRHQVNHPALLTEGGTARGGQRAGPVGQCIPVGTSQGVGPAQGWRGSPFREPSVPPFPCPCPPEPPQALRRLSAFPWNLPFLGSWGRHLPLCFCALFEDNFNETSLLEASLNLYEPGEGPAQLAWRGT